MAGQDLPSVCQHGVLPDPSPTLPGSGPVTVPCPRSLPWLEQSIQTPQLAAPRRVRLPTGPSSGLGSNVRIWGFAAVPARWHQAGHLPIKDPRMASDCHLTVPVCAWRDSNRISVMLREAQAWAKGSEFILYFDGRQRHPAFDGRHAGPVAHGKCV